MAHDELEIIVDALKEVPTVDRVETSGRRLLAWLKKEGLTHLCETIQRLGFDHCSCISAVDYSDHFTVVYHFWSTKKHLGIDAYIDISKDEHLPSIVQYYQGANWHEREAFDMMGIKFDGHPNLRRVLLMDDADYFPLRKDYRPAPEPDTKGG